MQPTGGGDKGNLEKAGEGLGGFVGQAADTVIGVFGSMMNNMGGWWAQSATGSQGSADVRASFGSERDAECRSHFDAHAAGGTRSYEEARPLYEFGDMAGRNPDYRGRSFDQVEGDLRGSWGADEQRRHGSWPDVRGYV